MERSTFRQEQSVMSRSKSKQESLPAKIREIVKISLEQADRGETVSHVDAMKQIRAWRKRQFPAFVLFLALLLTLSASGQEVVREYYDIARTKVKYEYQVDNSSRAKNGPYKSFSTTGAVYEAGSYKMGKKHGEWKGYDEYGSGQVTSIITYTEGAMNGVYKQWCFNAGKMFLCRDSYYRDDAEIRTKLYYPNGQLQKELDTEHGTLNNYFEDGKPAEETINGVHYSYFQSADGPRLVTSIRIDTVPCAIRYEYEPYRTGQLVVISFCESGTEGYRSFDYNVIGRPVCHSGKEGRKCLLDSSKAADAYRAYIAAPNPNRSNRPIEYTAEGDMVLGESNGALTVIHYNSTGIRREQRFADKNTPVSDQELDPDDHIVGFNRMYEDGVLTFEEDRRTGNEMSYFKNGSLKYEHSRSKGLSKEYYDTGLLKAENGLDAKGNSCCYERSYDASGKLVSEHIYASTGFVEHWRNYDAQGRIVKVDLVGHYNYQTPKEIADFLLKGYSMELKAVYTKQVHTSDGVLTEYPKGEELYRRSSKVLEDVVKRYELSSDDGGKYSAVMEYKRVVEHLLLLAKADTTALNTEVAKAKKVEEIRSVLGVD